ncbi:MAG: glycosyltransferase family 4 protein [Armatimonadetes bacterium]|nr:glycosyltransferase family 4 protein [Armatimonadota bacterium]
MTESPYRFGFVMDQQVGLKTQSLNFEAVLREEYPQVEAVFVPVQYASVAANPLTRALEKALPGSVRGTLAGVREIKSAFAGATFDAVLWATWAAKSAIECVRAAPAFLLMDMTPTQMEALGAHYGYSPGRARFLGGWKKQATDRLYGEATHLFGWNEWVAQSLRGDYGVPTGKVSAVSPGTDTTRFCPDTKARKYDGVTRLLFVGGDFVRKGGDLLLRYLRERAPGSPPVELHCVTRDTVTDAPANVHFHRGIVNNSPELARLYQQSDLFVLPTRADCYSLVALEAMASGLPVVITNMGGIGDIVATGETGVLLPEGDNYTELAAALDELIGDAAKRERMGRAGRDRAVSRFNCRAGVRTVVDAMLAAAEKGRAT